MNFVLSSQETQAQCLSLIINTCSFILRNLKWPWIERVCMGIQVKDSNRQILPRMFNKIQLTTTHDRWKLVIDTLPPLQTKPHLATTPSLVIDNFWFEPSCQIAPRGAGVRIKNCRWQVFIGRVSWWKCTRPFDIVLSWILENKLPLGIGCSGRIARLMR